MNSRPRLLVLASTFPSRAGDGTPEFVRHLAAYEGRVFDTIVLVPRVSGAPRREEYDGVRVERFPYFFGRFEDLADGAILENLRARPTRWLQVAPFVVAEALALRQLIRRHRPDVLHLHWIVPQGLAALVTGRGVPWLVTTLGGDIYALRDPVSVRLKRAVLRRAAAATTMNREMRARLIVLGSPPRATHVLPMGADVAAVQAHGAGVAQVSGRIVFAGRLVEKKGAAVLLDALRRLPSGREWSLDLIGDGPLLASLRRQAEGLAVRFRGQLTREALARAFAEAEVVVVPSVPAGSGDQDGLPVTLLEAMAAGCAIVASRIAGIDEAVVDGTSGVLVPPGDPVALAVALDALLADPDCRRRLGAAAAVRAEDFSVESMGERYVDLLRSITAGGPT